MLSNILKGASGGTTLDYITYASDDASLTTRTFSGVSIGAASGTREVFVVVRWTNSTTRSLSSASIAGTSATIGTTQLNSGNFGMAVFFATITSGTTADISVTLSGAATNMFVFVYRVTGRTNIGSNQVASYGDTGAVTRTSYSLANVVMPQNGFLLLNFTSGQTQDLALTSTTFTIDADLYPASGQNRASMSRKNLGQSQSTITANIAWGGTSIGCGVRMWTFN